MEEESSSRIMYEDQFMKLVELAVTSNLGFAKFSHLTFTSIFRLPLCKVVEMMRREYSLYVFILCGKRLIWRQFMM
ncbi:hypothetical protein AOU00_09150 [Paenibacillus polymyxa]|nr:hypothetical protein AOU00_09150 [Paenibacillus polymyxa]